MKELLLTNSSVVLIIESPVPSVTHEFLVNQKIIPSDFQIQGTPFYTPPISQIKYNNGFNITTEPSKIQLMTSKPAVTKEEKGNCLSELKDVSLKYVKLFNDINFKSIGINFQFIRNDLQFKHLIEQTIKPDNLCLKFEDNKGEVGTIKVSYNKWKGKQFNVEINKIKKIHPPPPTDVVLFNVNINYPNNYGEKVTIIEELIEDFEKSQKFIERF